MSSEGQADNGTAPQPLAAHARAHASTDNRMTVLSLAHANQIIEVALAERKKRNFQPLAVAVLDAGGHLLAFQREENAGFARYQIAYGKAWGALGMGFGTSELADRASKYPAFVAALATATDGRMIPSPGGVLIRDSAGFIIGAVGISGDVGPNDEICALRGIEAAGFKGVGGLVSPQ